MTKKPDTLIAKTETKAVEKVEAENGPIEKSPKNAVNKSLSESFDLDDMPDSMTSRKLVPKSDPPKESHVGKEQKEKKGAPLPDKYLAGIELIIP